MDDREVRNFENSFRLRIKISLRRMNFFLSEQKQGRVGPRGSVRENLITKRRLDSLGARGRVIAAEYQNAWPGAAPSVISAGGSARRYLSSVIRVVRRDGKKTRRPSPEGEDRDRIKKAQHTAGGPVPPVQQLETPLRFHVWRSCFQGNLPFGARQQPNRKM